ncbi:unnamed protein product, partial [Mesorhabditis spiculigera]
MDRDTFPKKLFANEDFERTIQEIISSPRKGKHYQVDDVSVYDVTDKQKAYYTKCFLHLMKTTQGTAVLGGALHGSENKIVDFFRKSGLDDDELSRIWSLSDVNEDGWLDLAEFCTAMHLIVLRVKGELPVPPILPPALKPPMTAPRTQSQVSSEGSRPSGESQTTSTTMQQNEGPDGRPNTFTRSEGNLSSQIEKEPPQFSDVPPLLVDSRPLPIKALPIRPLPDALLMLRSPQGPPPAPPSRPSNRSHMRSASLDLKQLAIQNLPINGISGPSSARHMSIPSNPVHAPPVPSRSEHGSAVLPTLAHVVNPEPIKEPTQKTIPGSVLPPSSAVSSGVQTEHKWIDPSHVENFIKNFGSQFQELWDREERFESGENESDAEKWERRVAALRRQNAELEKERATLAQIRIQLELRQQEMKPPTSSKPTQL